MIWTFANLKGGVGKSTLCVNVAAALVHTKKSVVICDLDPQSTSSHWYHRREALPLARRPLHLEVISIPSARSAESICSRSHGYEYVLVDTAANDVGILSTALEVTDLGVIPMEASLTSLDGTRRTIGMMAERRVPFRIVMSRVQPNVVIAETIRQRAQGDYKRLFAQTTVHQRVEFANADLSGRTVLESEPSGLATQEILKVTAELRRAAARPG